ncbi:DUF3857 domain-containing protein [uncultured Draconibacterium sp.]|uniref:DUF3857 domain-containing protein n=1 Tax=uncultured Draconibacterium sp. TaxID=1573823 RepID=UPI0032162D43
MNPKIKSTFVLILLLLVVNTTTTLLAQNFDAELISQITTIEVLRNKITKKHYFEIQINTREGEQYAQIEIPSSGLSRVSNINAYIKDLNNTIIKKLKKSEIKQHSSFSESTFYQDQLINEFTLKHNIYPYKICYDYEIHEDEFFYLDYWIPVIASKVPTKKAELYIKAPKSYIVNHSCQQITAFQKDSTEGNYTYSWITSYDGKLKSEILAPPLSQFLPQVILVPEQFKYEIKGSFKSWEDYGFWEYSLLKNLNDLPDSEITKIRNRIKGIEDISQQIKILYQYLQDETRYININIDTGGLKPYPASYVSENRYGDCKALSNYFKAVLEAVDIKSFYSSIQAGEKIDVVNKLMPSQQANHVILCVPIKTDTIWIDCTSNNPFGYVGTFIQNREVFVVDNQNSFFTNTPPLTPSQVLNERKVSLKYSLNKTSSAQFANTYRGENFEYLQQLTISYNKTESTQIIRDQLIESDFTVTNIDIEEFNRDSTNVKMNYEVTSHEIYKEYGNDLLIKLLPITLPKLESPEIRKMPIQINFPIYKKDELIYNIPNNYKINSVFTNKTIETKFGSYKIEFNVLADQIIISKSFLLKSGNYALTEYPEFYAFMKEVKQIENNTYLTTCKIY